MGTHASFWLSGQVGALLLLCRHFVCCAAVLARRSVRVTAPPCSTMSAVLIYMWHVARCASSATPRAQAWPCPPPTSTFELMVHSRAASTRACSATTQNRRTTRQGAVRAGQVAYDIHARMKYTNAPLYTAMSDVILKALPPHTGG